MTLRTLRVTAQNYGFIVLTLAISWFFARLVDIAITGHFLDVVEHAETLIILLSIVILFALGFVVYELAKPTVLPSFVLAIFFGMVVRDALSILSENPLSITTLITIGAVLILFGGGLETPFRKFRELMDPILSLAIVGTFLNAFLLSMAIMVLFRAFSIDVPLIASVLIGAALSSTDPAAIIPSFQSLIFRKPRVKHIAVSESAINDVVGAVLVSLFLAVFAAENGFESVTHAYASLGKLENILLFLKVMGIGAMAGLAGFGILQLWNRRKQRVVSEGETDAALFLAVPLAVYTVASVLGGSGYLAVFITGLLFSLQSHMKHVEHYFNHTVEGFMKPLVFILLGSMIDPVQLLDYAWVGIIAGLVFMFVLRPIVVFTTLLPYHFAGHKFSFKELAFLSFVRETGVIPAVLLITIRIANIPGAETMVAVGLWIILMTLIIEPPLTPLVAKSLGIAFDVPSAPRRKHAGPVAVLCSRGYSFPERMRTVVEWAKNHAVDNIALLHCPEEKYSDAFVGGVRKRAKSLFADMNRELAEEGRKEINFEFLCGPGLLQDNIERLIAEGDVSIIFVGSKMLDYRLEDVKRLDAPFYFM